MEQTGWSNFNEGCDLEAAVEDYFRKFGCYPSAVLADRIYQTRRNKIFCTQLGIRLSGPPLGRWKASETDTKIKRQSYRDACERNAIEGRNGKDRICSRQLGHECQPPAGALACTLFPFSSVLVPMCGFFSRPHYEEL
ncbi:MAG: transposase [Oscillospiraceae bacterium]|nr:transposase [Oscillospiraceae bacterium]